MYTIIIKKAGYYSEAALRPIFQSLHLESSASNARMILHSLTLQKFGIKSLLFVRQVRINHTHELNKVWRCHKKFQAQLVDAHHGQVPQFSEHIPTRFRAIINNFYWICSSPLVDGLPGQNFRGCYLVINELSIQCWGVRAVNHTGWDLENGKGVMRIAREKHKISDRSLPILGTSCRPHQMFPCIPSCMTECRRLHLHSVSQQ